MFAYLVAVTSENGDPEEDGRTLRLMRTAVHGVFAVLLAVALTRTLLSGHWPPLVPAVLLGAVYGAGAALDHRMTAAGARLWLAGVIGLWAVTLALSVDYSWLAFPIFFLCMHLLPVRAAVALITGLTAAVIAAVAVHQGGLGTGLVLGPSIGAIVAVLLALVYAGLYREARRRQALIEDLVRTRADLSSSQHRAGVLAERERLAREIHDTVAQGLSSVLLLLRAADAALPGQAERIGRAEVDATRGKLRLAQAAAADSLAEARRFVLDLAPPALQDTPLADALRRVCDGHGALFHLEGEPVELPTGHEVALLRVAQSALANATAHAGATRVGVTLSYLSGSVVLDVFDDGRGFDPARVRPSGTGYGLRAMRDRVTELGGALVVESTPGEGTAVAATIPLERA